MIDPEGTPALVEAFAGGADIWRFREIITLPDVERIFPALGIPGPEGLQ